MVASRCGRRHADDLLPRCEAGRRAELRGLHARPVNGQHGEVGHRVTGVHGRRQRATVGRDDGHRIRAVDRVRGRDDLPRLHADSRCPSRLVASGGPHRDHARRQSRNDPLNRAASNARRRPARVVDRHERDHSRDGRNHGEAGGEGHPTTASRRPGPGRGDERPHLGGVNPDPIRRVGRRSAGALVLRLVARHGVEVYDRVPEQRPRPVGTRRAFPVVNRVPQYHDFRARAP